MLQLIISIAGLNLAAATCEGDESTYTCNDDMTTLGFQPGQYEGIKVNYLSFATETSSPSMKVRGEEFEACTGAQVTFAEAGNVWEDPVADMGTKQQAGLGIYTGYFMSYSHFPEVSALDLVERLDTRLAASNDKLKWETVFPQVKQMGQYRRNGENHLDFLMYDGDFFVPLIRIDLLARDQVPLPNTWEELVEVVKRYHDTDINEDGEPDYGFCHFPRTGAGFWDWWAAEELYATWATYGQTQGPTEGFLFDEETLEPRVDGPAFESAVNVWKDLWSRGEDGCISGLFQEGRCAVGFSPPGCWKGVFLNGELGVGYQDKEVNGVTKTWRPEMPDGSYAAPYRLKPFGSTQIEKDGVLVECTAELCPKAEPIPAKGHFNANDRASILPPTPSAGKLINRAPFFWSGGLGTLIRKNAPEDEKQVMWDFFVYTNSPQASSHDVAAYPSWLDSWRTSQLPADGAVFKSFGWPAEAYQEHHDVMHWALGADANGALNLRLPGAKTYTYDVLGAEMAKFFDGETTLSDFKTTVKQGWSEETHRRGLLDQLSVYRASVGKDQLSEVRKCELHRADMDAKDPTICRKYDEVEIKECDLGWHYNFLQDTCLECPAGSYSAIVRTTECLPCSAGSYSITAGSQSCDACTPGKFTATEASTTCTNCTAGEVTSEAQQTACSKCGLGQFMIRTGQSQCELCEAGTFAASFGTSKCRDCNAERTTLQIGSRSPEDCVCPEGMYRDDGNGQECVACPPKMICPGGTDHPSFSTANFPKTEVGYMVLEQAPLDPYRCSPESACPGENVCAKGREGVACAVCAPGFTAFNGECHPCASLGDGEGSVITVLVTLIAILLVGPVLILTTRRPVFIKEVNSTLLSSLATLSINVVQVTGVFFVTQITWGEQTRSVGVAKIFSADIDILSMECAAPELSAGDKYLISTIAPVAAAASPIIWLAIHTVAQPALRKKFFSSATAWNATGTFIQLVYISIATTAVSPFICYPHPNKLASIAKYPQILCGHEEHTFLIILGLLLSLFAVGFIAFCLWFAWKAPGFSERKLASMQFLWTKYRRDVWWWGSLVAFRGLMVAFVPTLFPDNQRMQVFFLTMIFFAYVIPCCMVQPYKVGGLAAFEAFGMSMCGLIMTSASGSMPSPTESELTEWDTVSMSLFIVTYAVCGVVLLIMAGASLQRGRNEPVFYPCLTNTAENNSAGQVAPDLHHVCKYISVLDSKDVQRFVEQLSQFDAYWIKQAVQIVGASTTDVEIATRQARLKGGLEGGLTDSKKSGQSGDMYGEV